MDTKTKEFMDHNKIDISKCLFTFVKIFLIGQICVLSLLDAHQYLHFIQIGECEFIEFLGNLDCVQGGKSLIDNESSIHETVLLFQFLNLHWLICRRQDKNIFPLWHKMARRVISQKYPSKKLMVNFLPSQTLLIVATTFIKC